MKRFFIMQCINLFISLVFNFSIFLFIDEGTRNKEYR